MRICTKCGKNRDSIDFYNGNNGRYWCKFCFRKYQVVHYPIIIDKRKKYYRNWYKRNGRNRLSDYQEVILDWQKNNPEKVKVHKKVREAIKIGLLKRPNLCNKCGRNTKVSGHHYNYEKVLNVIWVCSSCHKLIHNQIDKLKQKV